MSWNTEIYWHKYNSKWPLCHCESELRQNLSSTCASFLTFVAQNSRIPRNETDIWNGNNDPGFLWKILVTENIVSASFYEIDAHVTVHRNKFLIIKTTRCTNFSNLFWKETLRVSDSSSVHHQEFFTVHTALVYVIQVCWQLVSRFSPILLSCCLKTCMTYTIAVCTVKNSW